MDELFATMNVDQLSGLLTGGILGVVIGSLATVGILFSFVLNILTIIGSWKVYKKFGEPGWKCLIPFYNTWVEYGYTWKPVMAIPVWGLSIGAELLSQFIDENSGWMILVGILTLAGWVISIIGFHKRSKAFGYGAGFTVGQVIFTSIFTIILGFGKSQYLGNTTEISVGENEEK